MHFTDFDNQIKAQFGLQEAEDIDHFSHDIGTCSFLNRDDAGNYRFIHRSFLDYFVAKEFNRLDRSLYSGRFQRPLTKTMIEFVDPNAIPEQLQLLLGLKQVIEQLHARHQFTKAVEIDRDDSSVPATDTLSNHIDNHICSQWPNFEQPATRRLTERIIRYLFENRDSFLGDTDDVKYETYVYEIKIYTRFARALRKTGLDQEYSDGYTNLIIVGDE